MAFEILDQRSRYQFYEANFYQDPKKGLVYNPILERTNQMIPGPDHESLGTAVSRAIFILFLSSVKSKDLIT